MMTARMTLNLTRTWLVLLASRSLKMAALIVVERSPQTSPDCDYTLELARVEKEKVQAEERRVQREREMMRERVELGFQGEEMRDAGAFAAKSLPEIKFQKMFEQTNDVLSFLNVFEKTCTFRGIQDQQLARILPRLINEKANKIYSPLNIDMCRSYDSGETEILRGFRLSSKTYLQKFRMIKRYGNDSYSQ